MVKAAPPTEWDLRVYPLPIGSMGLEYLPTFTIETNQMHVNIPYMDGIGYYVDITIIYLYVYHKSMVNVGKIFQSHGASGLYGNKAG